MFILFLKYIYLFINFFFSRRYMEYSIGDFIMLWSDLCISSVS